MVFEENLRETEVFFVESLATVVGVMRRFDARGDERSAWVGMEDIRTPKIAVSCGMCVFWSSRFDAWLSATPCAMAHGEWIRAGHQRHACEFLPLALALFCEINRVLRNGCD